MSAAFAHSLYDCVAEIDLIANTLEAIDAEDLLPELRDELERELNDAIAGTREKIDRTASVLAAFEAAELAATAEMRRLGARKDRIVRQRERLEGYVLSVLAAASVKKLDGFTSTLAARTNPVSVVIDDAAGLPAEFLRIPKPVVPDPTPDKGAIKAVLARGEFVAGCRLAQTVRLVRS
ncbi:MAG: siphovirus Gp157 family protein [Bryobacteraceae bacterium]